VLDVTRAALAPHTTLRLGGPARHLVTVTERDEIIRVVRERDVVVLAGGSNVVIGDDGVDATVLLIRSAGLHVAADGDHVLVTVEAGHTWDGVVAFAVAEGLAGIESLSGIPGSAGATPIQNVGAYGQEVAETIVSVSAFDRAAGTVRSLTAAECGFGYRSSVFKHNTRYVVLDVTYRLCRMPLSTPLRYAELARRLGVAVGERAPLAQVRQAVLALRAGKGMVVDPLDLDTYSVGSFFTNPVLDAQGYAGLQARTAEIAAGEPAAWSTGDGGAKISAAWLIERAGFTKGYQSVHPGVALSGKHTLALTNRGTGTTAALLGLAREIRDGVAKIFDVELHPEPVLIGCTL
jgi:UDP-N-acetylmuramate dehydrogenase